MKLKWIVEFSVDESWVADGFELTAERLKSMIEDELPHAYQHETAARIVKAPRPEVIRRIQGYEPETVDG